MIKIALIFVFFISSAFAIDRTPTSRYGFETGADLRLLKKYSNYLLLFETKNRKEITDHDYNQVMIGGYNRLNKNFRMGAFLQFEQGLRWDEDWRKVGSKWQWQKMNSHWDYSSVLDATYNDRLSGNTVWEMKSRLFYYHSRDAIQLRLRPGIRHFITRFGKPLWQFFTELEGYVPLTYGENSLYEYWLYLGTLYQFTPRFSLGPVISFRQRWFHPYENFQEKTNETYKASNQTTYLGINATYSW